ncbi:MAG: peptidylprolyl isomerase [Bacteroidaceae bacterium]|jgi:FKBP-type peptidyl-prolyl cis-trans isomerase SlyD|nr:peptidylprolyl isomerase [Bacteroidaceae bacterium]
MHKYITVAYSLYTDNSEGVHELVEQAPVEHPFQFITELGVALEAFEAKLKDLNAGDEFDFTLSVDEAYGPYEQEHVIELPKSTFMLNGRFQNDVIYEGAVIPLVNADGNRFQGLVLEVKEEVVIIDLNHPLAGKELHFKGSVVTSREATDAEVTALIKMMSGEGGCGCGCGCDGGCEGGCDSEGCGCGDHEHGCGCKH